MNQSLSTTIGNRQQSISHNLFLFIDFHPLLSAINQSSINIDFQFIDWLRQAHVIYVGKKVINIYFKEVLFAYQYFAKYLLATSGSEIVILKFQNVKADSRHNNVNKIDRSSSLIFETIYDECAIWNIWTHILTLVISIKRKQQGQNKVITYLEFHNSE